MDSNTGGSYTPPPQPPPPPPPTDGVPPTTPSPAGRVEELIQPTQPAKDPVLVLVLNLILGCVGYFIIGQWQKGAATIGVALVVGIFTCGIGMALWGPLFIATAIDGYMQAQQLQAGHPVGHWTFFKDHR